MLTPLLSQYSYLKSHINSIKKTVSIFLIQPQIIKGYFFPRLFFAKKEGLAKILEINRHN